MSGLELTFLAMTIIGAGFLIFSLVDGEIGDLAPSHRHLVDELAHLGAVAQAPRFRVPAQQAPRGAPGDLGCNAAHGPGLTRTLVSARRLRWEASTDLNLRDRSDN